MPSHDELADDTRRSLPGVRAGEESKAAVIQVLELAHVDESDLYRLRQPPYPNLDELARAMGELGQTTPIFVRPKGSGRFELISGYRRCAALRSLGELEVLARIYEGLSDGDAYALAVSENMDRGDLTDWERAQACLRLLEQGRSQEAIAAMFNWKDPRNVRNLLRVGRSSPRPVADALQNKQLQLHHALALTRLGEAPFSEEDAGTFTARAVSQRWSVRTIEKVLADEVLRRSSTSSTTEPEMDETPARLRQFKSGAAHLTARIDPARPETLDEVAEQLRKGLRLIAKYKRRSSGALEDSTIDVEISSQEAPS